MVEYESSLERDFYLECDHATDVERFQQQPVSIIYIDGKGKSRRYTPDVYVEYKNGVRRLYEIKYAEEVATKGKKYEEKWNEARSWAKGQGMEFSVLTEHTIRTPRWHNIWFTLGPSKCSSNNPHVPDLTAFIPKEGERYNDLCVKLAEGLGIEITKSAQILCYAIYHGLVFVDSFSTQQISAETVIRKRSRGIQSPFKSLLEELGGIQSNESNEGVFSAENRDPIGSPDAHRATLFKIPPKYEEKVNQRLQVVKDWLRQPPKKRTPRWRGNFCKRRHVCEKTVYNWVGAYQQDGVEGLIPNRNRVKKEPESGDPIMSLMEQARQSFLTPLVSLHKAYSSLEDACREQNCACPKESRFKKYVYKNTTASEFARKRGDKYLKSSFTPSLASFQGACAPMQVLQMDNTSFDVFPVDSEDREGLPPPNLTAAIDCYTRMATGFTVSFFPSSSQTVLEVLVQSILPKHAYVDAHRTQQDWPIQGFPVLLLVDNGMDFRSQAVKDFCAKYDIIVEYAPIRTPRFKAFVEEWFNVLHNALTAEDVAGTRPPLKERLINPDLKPEADAVLTLQEIDTWLHKWVLDEYHLRNPYGDYVPAPFLRWQEFRAGHTGVILPSPREAPADKREVDLLYLSTLQRINRVLRSDGVVWAHLKYNNRELAQVFSNIGSQTVEVLLNRKDVRSVWVVHPSAATPVKVELASGWAQAIAKVHGGMPINASAWAMEVTYLKKHFKRQISPFNYQKEVSRIQRQELVSNATKVTRSMRKAREKAKESTQKGLLGAIGSQPAEPTPVTDASPNGADLPVTPKTIDWSRIKPAGRRPRRSF
ncbi:MAG TPA: TnsA endonuclease N-terminal domain-containing protein [Candidatus Lokiarchaeia archaeon]|nr:TnsA endonuclease N-terminal domain-containing protein [Candidatus Lokiarchaeia archaeon]